MIFMLLVDAETMQRLDRQTIDGLGIPGIVLMENAGRGCTDVLMAEFKNELEEYLIYYNEYRPHQGIGSIPPIECLKNCQRIT